MVKTKTKQTTSFYSVLGKIGDILLWPVLIISLVSSFLMLAQRNRNKVTSVFGYSFVTVLSGSMVNDGFRIGDVVVTKQVNEKKIKIGDIIAFYNMTNYVSESKLNVVARCKQVSGEGFDFSEDNVETFSVDIDGLKKLNDKSSEYLKEAREKKARVYFHRVVGVYYDDENNFYYKTKGSNNSSVDAYLARGDLLVGKYIETPATVRKVMQFCASPMGMIVLVCVPLSILVLLQLLSLIEQVSVINLEKKLISGKLSIYSKEVQEDLKSNHVERYNKIYIYFLSPPEDRPVVKQFLWSHIENATEPKDKYFTENAAFEKANERLDEGDSTGYWNEWIESTTKKREKNALIKLRNSIFIDNHEEELKENIKLANDTAKALISSKEEEDKNNKK